MDKLVQIVEYFWSNKAAAYRKIRTRSYLAELKTSLLNAFSPMRRSYRPKPNKPGLRPITITKPHMADRLVLAALAELLDIVFDLSPDSHGFRKRKGLTTFFKQVEGWGPLDRLIKADVVKCFDTIDHQLILSALQDQDHLGEEKRAFVNLISTFLTTKIR